MAATFWALKKPSLAYENTIPNLKMVKMSATVKRFNNKLDPNINKTFDIIKYKKN